MKISQFYNRFIVLIKTMALMTLAESTNTHCVQSWHVY